jgi:hypothetical protein
MGGSSGETFMYTEVVVQSIHFDLQDVREYLGRDDESLLVDPFNSDNGLHV